MDQDQTLPKHDERVRPRGAESRRRTRKILALVDGSASTGRVIEFLIGMNADGLPIQVTVLNVQPAPETWRLRGYGSFKREEVEDRLVHDLGEPIVSSAGRRLKRAGIDHKRRIEIGNVAETVLRCAREEECDLIVVGETRPGPLRRWLVRNAGVTLASPASEIAQLAALPVIVIG